jgi:hypothetical protein
MAIPAIPPGTILASRGTVSGLLYSLAPKGVQHCPPSQQNRRLKMAA